MGLSYLVVTIYVVEIPFLRALKGLVA